MIFCLVACTTKQNTAGSRFWQGFTAKYNTYFNGHEAYKEGVDAQISGNVDNYTEILPFFPVGNEATRNIGKSQFDRAITKSEKAIQLHSIKVKPEMNPTKSRSEKMKQFLRRKEFNPFLKHAWLLMGQAQFQKGDFLGAASTFSYITRRYAAEPPVVQEARTWMARSYAELGWFYDAEDALDKVRRDSIPARLGGELAATRADLLLRQERFADALPYLTTAVRKTRNRKLRARLYFLLGQVEQQLGHRAEAYRALGKCVRLSPPYQLEFNARILQTEVFPEAGGARKMTAQLRGMARSEKNKEYLDQVYYALGNIFLTQNDTAAAIAAYEQGRTKATRSGAEKGVLLLRLGQLYWERGRYDKAQTCYNEALGMIDNRRKDYAEVTRRSRVLDKLVPYTSAIQLQDSLQALSLMSEKERNAAIDRVIEALRQQEKAAERARRDSAADARADENGEDDDNPGMPNTPRRPQTAQQTQAWYFYNPMLVQQGKEDFRKHWGNRKNEDNWRRSNKTVVQLNTNAGVDYAALDSIEAAREKAAGSEEEGKDSIVAPADDPHQRDYYMKQIPFTKEQKEASDLILMDALYNAGLIEKDDLEDFPLAARTLQRIVRQYPTFEKLEDVYYQLFLLYSRWGRPSEANTYRNYLATKYPNSPTTRRILDPDYLRLGRDGKAIEDSLYTATYMAYRNRQTAEVERNFALSTEKFSDGINRPKFILVHALSRIGKADSRDVAKELRELVTRYPQSDVSEMAGMIVNGLEAGRRPGSGAYNLGSLWERRTAQTDTLALGAKAKQKLSAERNTPFVVLIAYAKDSIKDNQLLYDLAHFNFTGFYVRNFDISKVEEFGEVGAAPATASGSTASTKPAGAKTDKTAPAQAATKKGSLVEFRISGFNSYDEAHQYAQDIYRDKQLRPQLRRAKMFLISQKNLELIPAVYSFSDYQQFFTKHYAPMKLNPELPLDLENAPVVQKYEDVRPTIYPVATKPTRADSIDKAKADSIAKANKAVQDLLNKQQNKQLDKDEYYLPEQPSQPRRQTDTEGTEVPIEPKKQKTTEKKQETEVPVEPTKPEKKDSVPEKKQNAPEKKQETPQKKQDVPQKKENPLVPKKQEKKEDFPDDSYPMTNEERKEAEKQQKKQPVRQTEKTTQTTPERKKQDTPVEDSEGGWYPVE